ncbi:GNAT family N-acetyltransferase [Candidatus Gracilibacteria bacterium]|nr:MAG: GNAT family N-acetyltransferase [Candidatus Gracilibacteria bacterium]
MDIRKATIMDLDYITKTISEYYKDLNTKISLEYYQSSIEKLTPYIKERLSEGERVYKYFIAEDGGERIGMLNLFTGSSKKSEILLCIANNEENTSILLDYGISLLQEEGLPILIQTAESEKYIAEKLQNMNIKKLATNWII